MERRHLVAALAGLLLVGGAVGLLRIAGQGQLDSTTPPTVPPPPTSLTTYAAQGVLVPSPGPPPPGPGRLVVKPGPNRLQLSWASAVPGGRTPAGAAGYEVRWGSSPDKLTNERLVAEPATEIDGLADNAPMTVSVSTVDAFGQRSAPSTTTGRPRADAATYSFSDHFHETFVPDPRLWRVSSQDSCTNAGRAGGTFGQLLVTDTCQGAQVTMRARTPFRLAPPNATGELGRFTIDTNAPGENGQLDLDLVPGPVDLLDESAQGPVLNPDPNSAQDDPELPPGTIRVQITTTVGPATASAQVRVAPGSPRLPPSTHRLAAVPLPTTGVSARWDIVLRTDGIRVLCDGVEVAAGNVVPTWTSATALIGFGGPIVGDLNAAVNLIGFTGAPTSAPPLLTPPDAQPHAAALAMDTPVTPAVRGLPPVNGDSGAQLRLTLLPVAGAPQTPVWNGSGPVPVFEVEVNGQRFPTEPAIPGTPLLSAVRYPLIAQLPPDVLVPQAGAIPVTVLTNLPTTGLTNFEVLAADLELTLAPGTKPTVPQPTAATAPPPATLAMPTVTLLDAGGLALPANQPLPTGRVVLNLQLDGPGGERLNGQVAGLAGFDIWLDGTKLATVPTTAGGPGVAGQWQIALDTGTMPPGQHTIDMHGFSTDNAIASVSAAVTFTVKH
ncbi:MAG TPA: hypothetical protein VGM75_18595 [Pseudonocardiaceae bacterium]